MTNYISRITGQVIRASDPGALEKIYDDILAVADSVFGNVRTIEKDTVRLDIAAHVAVYRYRGGAALTIVGSVQQRQLCLDVSIADASELQRRHFDLRFRPTKPVDPVIDRQ